MKGAAADAFLKPVALPADRAQKADALTQKHEAEEVDMTRYRLGDSVAERRIAALQAEAFRIHQRATRTGDLQALKEGIRICLGSAMWPLTRQPVPDLLRDLQSAYTGIGRPAPALQIGLIRRFRIDEHLGEPPFFPERITNTYALMQLAMGMSDPRQAAALSEMERQGYNAKLLPMALLADLQQQIPLAFGWDSPFGKQLRFAVDRLLGPVGGTLPPPLRQAVESMWPGVRSYAEKLDVLKIVNVSAVAFVVVHDAARRNTLVL
jgi:hypothetical protein